MTWIPLTHASGADPSWIDLVPWAALIALVGLIVTTLERRATERRDRRRSLYGGAYRAAVAWHEMLYRVRRRAEGSEQELVDRFHDLQEQFAYYRGWLSSESAALAESYRRLTDAVQDQTREPIREAWDQPPKPPDQQTEPATQVALPQEAELFLRDVREHLAWNPWVRRRVPQRYPDAGEIDTGVTL